MVGGANLLAWNCPYGRRPPTPLQLEDAQQQDQEEECRRALERAELAENKLKDVEQELETVGENMKQLEISAEKATEREEKLKDKILNLLDRFKVAEARYEYGEMNITKLNHRIDDIEDEIYREKLKIKKVSDELNDTFDDMLDNY